MLELLAVAVVICILIIFPVAAKAKRGRQKREQYYQTEYASQTQKSYEQVMSDEGLLGEFSIYKALQTLEGPQKFLFNLYLPKWNGGTTELDVVLLHESGIYVFESKNYGGWIFGSEGQKYWTQTLPVGRRKSQKHRFYNPILQNEGHLDVLYKFLRPTQLLNGPPPYYSYIVFSNRCVLKDVPRKSKNHYILYLGELLFAVQERTAEAGARLTAAEIELLYERLEPYSHADETVKQAHIENIQWKYR